MRRAKIVATLGPATSSYENIRAIIEAGVDVARMNLSHGTYDVHEEVYGNVRKAAEDTGRPVAILVDLQGPKIRLGKFSDGPHELAEGDIFTITTEDVLGTKEQCGTTFKGLPQDVKPGDFLLVDDGKVKLRVLDTDGVRVRTEVVVAGAVSNNKGINLPGVAVNVPALSEKDEDDLRWGLRLGADYIALSFVRNASDITRVHEIMREEGVTLPVIAKIEKPQAVDALEEIVDAFDGIMVARGDLGVELPLEAVPIVQKRAVELARRMAKPVIVATQMLESMISSPIPTRAETSDVANAVLDGADAVMLSGETSVGEFPVITVSTMARIVAATEEHGLERIPPLGTKPRTQGGAITLAAAEVATHDPHVRLWTNRDGSGVTEGAFFLDLLVKQVASPVRWDLCMSAFADAGVSGLVELAPAGTLTGLAKRALRGTPAVAVKTPADLPAAAELLSPSTS